MSQTVLSLVQQACYEIGITPPSTLVSLTSPANAMELQYLNLFYAVGRDLRQARWWPQLKRNYTMYMQPGRNQYALPLDFYASVPMTGWDQANKWTLIGPMTDRERNFRQYGYITVENRKAYEVYGPDQNPNSTRGQFYINPTPDATIVNTPITFDYISRSWLQPPNWTAGTAYTTASYVNVNGNIYKSASNANAGTVAPSMAYGVGQDGGVFWLAITTAAWGTGTLYGPGDYVTNGGNLYYCVTGGTSGITGPTGTATDTTETDGTVTWQYYATPAWAGETAFVFGSYILIGSQYYRCVTPGVQGNNTQVTGKIQPTWTPTTESDGTVTWTYQTAAYEALISNSDLCLFDDELMVVGLKYRIQLAKGLDYQENKQLYETMKDTATARWNSGRVLRLADNGVVLAGLNPNCPEGNFGN